jgi:toxin YoeB
MSYVLSFSEIALADLQKHKKIGDKIILKKIERLLNELLEHPTTGTGRPEQLKHKLAGLYSRRINQKHRMIYTIDNETDTIYVLSAWAHYSDK